MKHRTIATALILFVLLFFMIWSFGSSAANPNEAKTKRNSLAENEASEVFQERRGEEGEDADADLGKWGSRMDREEYLRQRDDYIGLKRGFEAGLPFNPEVRRRAIDQMERQEQRRALESVVSGDLSPAAGGAWVPIGPTTIANGQALSGGNTAVSGRVTAVVVDPTNPNNVYLGTAQGGVWRSLNAGTTWETIFDNADSLAIGALALAPSDPTKLYVGTGEFNACADCFFGAGLYRIDTVNTTPSLVGPINPIQTVGTQNYNIFNGRGITKIVVDPTNAATIFVTTARGIGGMGANAKSTTPPIALRGLWRSTNATNAVGSVTFQKFVVTAGATLDTENLDTTDIVMEPGTPNNLLVAMIGSTASNGGVYRTTNALAGTPTFTQVYTAASGVRLNLAITKVGAVVTAYAATSEPASGTNCTSTTQDGVVRKQVDPFSLSDTWANKLPFGGGFCGGQCFYDIAIAVSPSNASEVYLGGSARGSGGCSDGMKKSTDGFAAAGNTLRDDNGVHADAHALFYDTAGNVYFGNDGGIWKRSSTAAAGTAWTNLNSSPLNTLQFESIAVHPTDQFMMIGGTQDNGTEFQQTSAGNWRNAEGGDGGYALIDQSATDTTNVTMYHTFFNNSSQIGFDRIFKTACLPIKNSWPTRGTGFGGAGDPEDPTPFDPCDGGTPGYLHNGLVLTSTVLFYAPMALGPGSPNTVYFGADRLYRSTDRGDTMTVASQVPLTTPASPISTIAISRSDDNVRLVGLQNGQVWGTSTGSSTLVNLAPPIPANPSGSATNKFIGRAMVDPNNKNVAYITLSYYAAAGQGIWKISNLVAAAGTSPAAPAWTAAGNGIPSIPINAFAIDPANSNNLYAGTDIGVYFSGDGGANWSPYGTGLPRVAVFDLQIQPTSRILRAATHGRGVWENPLVAPPPSTIQFSSPTLSITEGPVSATVTVTRSDSTVPASVNYATADTSGANACDTITGAASSRCDYIATSGTLDFAAGEGSKTISIPLWSDSYVEGAETFTVVLSNATGANVTLGAPSTITVTINDSGFSGPNQIDSTGFFVRAQYIDFLNREPDTAGFNFWVNNIDSCGADVGCREVKRIDTSAAFFLSIEFKETGYLVERIYKAAYGDGTGASTLGGAHTLRVPVVRLNEFLPDTQRITRGVVVLQTGWEQVLEANKQAFTQEFVQRSRFQTAFPLTLTPTQFVDALNDNAKSNSDVKPLSAAERTQLINALTNGSMSRAQVLRAVAEDTDLLNSEINRAFVLMEFFGYLRRNPNDPQDSDYTGYDFWLQKLNQFNGSYVNAEMVKAFISSIEYRKRFAQ
jgi:hypothetical protein